MLLSPRWTRPFTPFTSRCVPVHVDWLFAILSSSSSAVCVHSKMDWRCRTWSTSPFCSRAGVVVPKNGARCRPSVLLRLQNLCVGTARITAYTLSFLHMAWTKSVREKGWRSPQAWRTSDASEGEACELAEMPCERQATPLSARIRMRAYGEHIWC